MTTFLNIISSTLGFVILIASLFVLLFVAVKQGKGGGDDRS